MKVLLLSCNTGGGHNSAALAIKDCFESLNVECNIKDSLAYGSAKSSKIISGSHVFIYRNMPKLFGVGYKFEENHPPKSGKTSLMFNLATMGCENIVKDIKQSRYDAVVCTHIFSAMLMTKIRKQGLLNVPTYLVATDYTCSPGVNQTDVDGYFIPAADLIQEFIDDGLDKDKLFVSGIPVNPKFMKKSSHEYAKGLLKLPESKRTVLLMCGSMGCGPIKQLAELLPEVMPEDSHLVAICGNNRHLYKSLQKNAPNNMTVVGFTSRIPVYMDASSVILTKPGGLSSTEAAVKNLPMIFIDAVPGCETKNLEYFTSHGFAKTAQSVEALADLVLAYLKDDAEIDNARRVLKENFSTCSAQIICEEVLRQIKQI